MRWSTVYLCPDINGAPIFESPSFLDRLIYSLLFSLAVRANRFSRNGTEFRIFMVTFALNTSNNGAIAEANHRRARASIIYDFPRFLEDQRSGLDEQYTKLSHFLRRGRVNPPVICLRTRTGTPVTIYDFQQRTVSTFPAPAAFWLTVSTGIGLSPSGLAINISGCERLLFTPCSPARLYSVRSHRRLHETRALGRREEEDKHSLRAAHQSVAHVAWRKSLDSANAASIGISGIFMEQVLNRFRYFYFCN